MHSPVVAPILLAITLAGSGAPLEAQSARFVVDQWAVEQGLPQHTVTSIAQTPDGYLWLSTFGGLVRFDGLRFTTFLASQHPGLGSDRGLALAVDSAGALWIGTEDGLSRYAAGKFTLFGTKDGLPDETIRSLAVDRAGTLWIGTLRGGLAVSDGRGFRPFAEDPQVSTGAIPQMATDDEGATWVWAGRLCRKGAGERLFRCGREAVPGGIEAGLPLGPAASGGMWLTAPGGILRLRRGQITRYGARDGLPDSVRHVLEDSRGGLLVSGSDGLSYLPPGPWPRTREVLDAREGSGAWPLWAVFRDRENVLWAGTSSDGLLRLRPRLFRVYTTADGLSTDNVTATISDRDGRLWIGNNCSGWLDVMKAGKIHTFRTASGERIGCPWSLALERDGALWVGGYGSGLFRIASGRITHHLTPQNSGLTSGAVLALLVDRHGVLWAGTENGGLNRIEHGRVTAVFSTAQGLVHPGVRVLHEAHDGALWIGTLAGVSRMRDGRFTSYRTSDGLPSGLVRAILEEAGGAFWFGTYGGGLARFKDGRFVTIGTAAGLAEDIVSSITEDAAGNFWMTGNRGVFRVSHGELNAFADGRISAVHSFSYGKADGLISPETNGGFQPAATRDAQGRLWLPTLKGLAMMDPTALEPDGAPPGVAIEEMRIDGVAASPDGEIRVASDARNIEITYAGLSTAAPEHTRFRYRLDGLDDEWVDVGARRTAYFSRLKPGVYRFEVSAVNRAGIWNTVVASLPFSVLAPFWATSWFRLGLAALLLAVAAGVIRWRFAQLRANERRQLEFARRFIEGQETERQRIAGELHDAIGQGLLVARNRAALGLQGPQEPEHARRQFEAIAAVVTETLEDARRISRNLRPHELDRLGLGAAIQAAVDQIAEGSGVAMTADVERVDDALSAETRINLYRIAQEGLNNVVKHSGATNAMVRLFSEDGSIHLMVIDNGKGFDAAVQSAFGLSSIAERVRLIGGVCEIRSEPGSGTTIAVSVQAAPAGAAE